MKHANSPQENAAPRAHWLLPAGLALTAFCVPVSWTRSFVCEYTLPKILCLCAGTSTAALGLLLSVRSGGLALGALPLQAPLLAGLAVLGASAFFSVDPYLSWIGRHNSFAFGAWSCALYAVAYALCAWGCAHEPTRRRTLRAVLLGALIVGAYACLQAAGLEPFRFVGALPAGRAVSTLGSPVHLGAYLAAALPLCLHAALGRGMGRALGWASLLFVIGGLLASVSRGAWLASASAAAAYLALSGRLALSPRNRGRLWATACVALLLASVAAWRLCGRSRQASESPRIAVWKTAWNIFKEHPWLGLGPDTFEQGFRRLRPEEHIRWSSSIEFQAHAHNDLLQALATTGLAGLAAYLFLLWSFLSTVRKSLADPERRGLASACGAAVLGLWICMEFNPVSSDALVLAALAAGLLPATPASPSPWLGRLAPTALALLSASSMGFGARLAWADRECRAAQQAVANADSRRSLEHFQRAVRLAPCEPAYSIAFVNYLGRLAGDAVGRAPLEELLAMASRVAENTASCRPNNVHSHYVKGFAALLAATKGFPERSTEAAKEFDAALLLDPSFTPLLQARAAAASLQGDKKLEAELLARAQRLRRLSMDNELRAGTTGLLKN